MRFQRLTGRSGPGAGRTAKLYRRSDTEIGVSLPERRYDLAAEPGYCCVRMKTG